MGTQGFGTKVFSPVFCFKFKKTWYQSFRCCYSLGAAQGTKHNFLWFGSLIFCAEVFRCRAIFTQMLRSPQTAARRLRERTPAMVSPRPLNIVSIVQICLSVFCVRIAQSGFRVPPGLNTWLLGFFQNVFSPPIGPPLAGFGRYLGVRKLVSGAAFRAHSGPWGPEHGRKTT